MTGWFVGCLVGAVWLDGCGNGWLVGWMDGCSLLWCCHCVLLVGFKSFVFILFYIYYYFSVNTFFCVTLWFRGHKRQSAVVLVLFFLFVTFQTIRPSLHASVFEGDDYDGVVAAVVVGLSVLISWCIYFAFLHDLYFL